MRINAILLFTCAHLLLVGCSNDSVDDNRNQSSKVEIDSFSKAVLQEFSVSSDGYKNDSNCLSFYCCRNYDTTTLFQIRKQQRTISGVYYQLLPNYHRFITDYANRNNQLLFFEGYSFTIDSAKWQLIVDQARLILNEKIDMNIPKVTDATTYGLLYNNQIQKGRTGAGDARFDKFDRFLKDSLLDEFMHARKPIMYKITK